MSLTIEALRGIVERQDTQAGKLFDLSIQCLIVISLVSFSLETLPDLSPNMQNILAKAEIICVAIFSAEYLLRLALATRKLRFVFSFFGVVDLLAILPSILVLGFDLRAVRAFRLLRLFRILKLARYSVAIKRFHRAFIIAKEELILFSALSLILLYLSAVGIYFFESKLQPEVFSSVFHSLWWAVTTLTTVGYGDMYPISAGGKFFTFFVLIIGLGLVSVPTGLIASALSQARRGE